MDYSTKNIRKFVSSHYFYGGVRQALGVIVPAALLLTFTDRAELGLAATFGALCVSIVDQPGPLRHRKNEMLGCTLLGSATAAVTALSTGHDVVLWLAVIAQCFFFSLFAAFGRKGGLIGFACLMLMTLTMHNDYTPAEAWIYTAAVLVGGLWYTLFSSIVNKLQWYRQEQQAISVCIFASAEYLNAKAALFDIDRPMEDAYTQVINRQAAVVEQQDAARDVVLRALPRSDRTSDQRRARLFNLFIDIVDLHETVVAVHTDYDLMRRTFAESDLLVFFRDLLSKLGQDVEAVGLAIARDMPTGRHINVKAEIRAIEYEIELLKESDFPRTNAEAYTALIMTFRRARNAVHIVDRLHRHADPASGDMLSTVRIDASLQRFLSHQDFSPARLTSNLKLSSPNFRHAVRVTLAAAIGMTVSGEWLVPHHAMHTYWVVLTIIVIMKPGFSLSKQRNLHRISGTVIGCLLVLALLYFVHNKAILLTAMLLAAIMGNSLVQLYYLASAAFNTAFVLLSFNFLSPGSLMVVGERLLDTAVGSAIALACSYVLPYWEYLLIKPQVQRAIASNRSYLEAARQMIATAVNPAAASQYDDVEYRLARKHVHIAFGNFASSFYRMMLEPKSKQRSVAEFNTLLIQCHELAARISASAPLLASLPRLPQTLSTVLDTVIQALAAAEKGQPDAIDDNERVRELGKKLDQAVSEAETGPDAVDADTLQTLKHLVYQVRQMTKTSQTIRKTAALVQLPA
jgi:uncharacterized membrane protein YccC